MGKRNRVSSVFILKNTNMHNRQRLLNMGIDVRRCANSRCKKEIKKGDKVISKGKNSGRRWYHFPDCFITL